MSIQEIDFSKTLTDEQVYETVMKNYSNFSLFNNPFSEWDKADFDNSQK